MDIIPILIFVAGSVFGAGLFWVLSQRLTTAQKQDHDNIKAEFGDLSKQALDQNLDSFLKLAENKFSELLKSSDNQLNQKKELIDQSIVEMKSKLEGLDKSTNELTGHVKSSQKGIGDLADSTQKLSRILSSSQERGQWGERMVEDILSFIANDEDDKNLEDLNDNNEKNLIKNIVNLNEKSVEDLMIPRSEIIALDHDKSYNEILEVIKDEGHSRFPVYKKNMDNVIGFFHIKDFIKSSQDTFQMNEIIRDVLYVAPKSPILDLLKTMRSSRIHIGLVVDGVGGVDGLVTIEDLVEEIVGEIEDEHDAEDEEELVFKKSDNSITVDASYRVEDLEEYFAINIPRNEDDETSSVGGLVYEKINRIPKNNEIIDFNDELRIKIIKSNNRKIEIVEVNKNN